MRHRDARLNHIIENWSFADEAARLALADALPEDIGKIGFQEDNSTYWRLVSDSPVDWVALAPVAVGGGGSDQWKRHYQEKLTVNGKFSIPALPSNYRNVRITVYAASTSTAGDNADVLQLFLTGKWQVWTYNWDGTTSAFQMPFSDVIEMARLRSSFSDASVSVFEILGYNNNGEAGAAKTFRAENLVILADFTVERRVYWGVMDNSGPVEDFTIQARDSVSNELVAGSTVVVEISGKTD